MLIASTVTEQSLFVSDIHSNWWAGNPAISSEDAEMFLFLGIYSLGPLLISYHLSLRN